MSFDRVTKQVREAAEHARAVKTLNRVGFSKAEAKEITAALREIFKLNGGENDS